jgi:hypothetical protein
VWTFGEGDRRLVDIPLVPLAELDGVVNLRPGWAHPGIGDDPQRTGLASRGYAAGGAFTAWWPIRPTIRRAISIELARLEARAAARCLQPTRERYHHALADAGLDV